MEIDKRNLLTEGNIVKKLILFAVPLFIGNLCQQLYNTAMRQSWESILTRPT